MLSNILLFGGLAAAGYVLAIYTWPALRAWIMVFDVDIAEIRRRAGKLESWVRRLRGG
jgi:hypothetical protein